MNEFIFRAPYKYEPVKSAYLPILESEINVRVRLLILENFPTRTALIPDRTFINS